MEAEDTTDKPIYTRFENYDEFVRIQDQILSLDLCVEPKDDEDRDEHLRLWKLIRLV